MRLLKALSCAFATQNIGDNVVRVNAETKMASDWYSSINNSVWNAWDSFNYSGEREVEDVIELVEEPVETNQSSNYLASFMQPLALAMNALTYVTKHPMQVLVNGLVITSAMTSGFNARSHASPRFSLLTSASALTMGSGFLPSANAVCQSPFDLNDLNASQGLIFQGLENSKSGRSVSSAGDVNGDGFADMLIGARYATPQGSTPAAGETYLIFGRATGWPNSFDLNNLNATQGIVFQGPAGESEYFGDSVSSAGDVNGDGFADILIGAHGGDPQLRDQAGKTYLSGWSSPFDLNNLNDLNAPQGVVFQGRAAFDASGISVSSAGDVNGNGFADILIGAPSADPQGRTTAGETYLIFGRASGWSSPFDLNDLNDLSEPQGVVFQGQSAFYGVGGSVSSAGDVDGDGFADMLIGAVIASPLGRDRAGETYLIFGRATGWPSPFDLNDLNAAQGVVFQGRARLDLSGSSVSCAGDVNGDGFADVLIGAANSARRAGETYLIFGRASSGWSSPFDLNDLNATQGVVFEGRKVDEFSGASVSSAGDVNGDGFADMLIGAYHADTDVVIGPVSGYRAGETYLIFGRASGWSSPFDLNDLNAPQAIVFQGRVQGDNSGFSVSSAGDVNNDGLADILIGAPLAAPQGRFWGGETYLIFGVNNTDCELETTSTTTTEPSTSTSTTTTATEPVTSTNTTTATTEPMTSANATTASTEPVTSTNATTATTEPSTSTSTTTTTADPSTSTSTTTTTADPSTSTSTTTTTADPSTSTSTTTTTADPSTSTSTTTTTADPSTSTSTATTTAEPSTSTSTTTTTAEPSTSTSTATTTAEPSTSTSTTTTTAEPSTSTSTTTTTAEPSTTTESSRNSGGSSHSSREGSRSSGRKSMHKQKSTKPTQLGMSDKLRHHGHRGHRRHRRLHKSSELQLLGIFRSKPGQHLDHHPEKMESRKSNSPGMR